MDKTPLEKFIAKHPIVLKDGRRFQSLYCAAQTILHSGKVRHDLTPVIDERDKSEYDIYDLMSAKNESKLPERKW